MKVKKQWFKPKLIVLLKEKMQERILQFCKAGSYNGPSIGPIANQTSCSQTTNIPRYVCIQCDACDLS
ncbi:MAG: hypothetical protein PHY94_00585 [Candidatus Omnitrophica bacterium]|nr:hypothetical protein [Candidatus Omnitrophota bacterium]